jgi:hypothetical protein
MPSFQVSRGRLDQVLPMSRNEEWAERRAAPPEPACGKKGGGHTTEMKSGHPAKPGMMSNCPEMLSWKYKRYLIAPARQSIHANRFNGVIGKADEMRFTCTTKSVNRIDIVYAGEVGSDLKKAAYSLRSFAPSSRAKRMATRRLSDSHPPASLSVYQTSGDDSLILTR